MTIGIAPLTPSLLPDYLHFFDHVAFADHPEWSQCYCLHFHFQSAWDDEPPRPNRDRAIELINSGVIRGYLAYADDQVAGWCSANAKSAYCGLARRAELRDTELDAKIKSVVCFLTAPRLRGRGIAARLLERVCADAKEEGYAIVEGYPLTGETDIYGNHHGPLGLYRKMGFEEYKRLEHDYIVRRYL